MIALESVWTFSSSSSRKVTTSKRERECVIKQLKQTHQNCYHLFYHFNWWWWPTNILSQLLSLREHDNWTLEKFNCMDVDDTHTNKHFISEMMLCLLNNLEKVTTLWKSIIIKQSFIQKGSTHTHTHTHPISEPAHKKTTQETDDWIQANVGKCRYVHIHMHY
jgi:hypothetical protein